MLDDPRRGVVFDLFGTLTDGALERTRETHYDRLADVLGVPCAAFAAIMRDSFPARALGEIGDPPAILRELCRRLGVALEDERLAVAVELRLSIERALATPRDDAARVLATLRGRGVPVGVLSDCGPETPAIWPTHPLADLVARPVFSCDVGMRKPDPALYALAAERIGVRPQDCVYVGDGGSRELTGAREAGMLAVKLAVPGEDWGPALRFDPDDGWDGPVVRSLSELFLS